MPSPFYSTTARWALRYLLGTSNVSDIDAGFLALASDIDALPLSLLPAASSGATATAVDGQMLNCTGAAQTVTLPASAKGMVGVRAGGTQTGANPVTVTAAGGALIKGVGHSAGATSILLGTVGASVVLLWDGANWLIVAGQQNTGWVALTLQSGFIVVGAGFYTPAARLVGDRVYLSGSIKNNTGGTTSAGSTVWATVPSSCSPANTVAPAAAVNDTSINVVQAGIANGSTSLTVSPAITNTRFVTLDGSYRLG